MISKSVRSVALLVPFFIVAIVWVVASVYLFQTPPEQEFLTHAQREEVARETAHSLRGDLDSMNYGPTRQRILGQQFIPNGYQQNMRASMLPPYAPSMNLNRFAASTMGMNDYFAAVSQDGSFHWAADRMPLRVYISDGRNVEGYHPEFRNMLSDAFNEWCNNSKGMLSWKQVNSAKQADVVCVWTSNATVKPGSVEAGQTRTLIQTNRDTGEGRIASAHISILTELMGRNFSRDNMYKTCLHEVGHALGLQGHSDVSSDIMYPIVNDTQVAKLRPRDINTLTHLYTETGYTAYNPAGVSPSAPGSVMPFANSGAPQPDVRRTRSFSAGAAPNLGGISPFSGNGMQSDDNGSRPFSGRHVRQSEAGAIQPFTNSGRRLSDSEDSGSFSGNGIQQQQSEPGGIQPFKDDSADRGSSSNGGMQPGEILPFTGGGVQSSDGDAPQVGMRHFRGNGPQFVNGGMPRLDGGGPNGGMGQFGGSGARPFANRGIRQFDGGGIQPFQNDYAQKGHDDGMQQTDDSGIQPFDNFDRQGADQGGAGQWLQSSGQGFGNQFGGHHHRHGNWNQPDAYGEFLRRSAQPNGTYN